MTNKPIILSLIISIVFFLALILSSIVNNPLYQLLICLIILFSFSFYIGKSHAKKFKEEMPKISKIKISLYYFAFWFVFISSIVILMLMNTTLKDLPLFSFNPKEIVILLTIFLMNFVVFSIFSLVIYYALGFGCKLGLPKTDE